MIAITGGSGFIAGRFIARSMVQGIGGERWHLRALAASEASRQRIAAAHPAAEALLLPSGSEAQLVERLRGVRVLLHAGWSTVPATADLDPITDLRQNGEGALRLFRAAISAGVRRIVFISSGGTVYGEAEQPLITEAHPLHPVGAYGASKLIAERYLTAMAHHAGVEHVILRPSNVYGRDQAHDQPQGVVEHWLRAALRGQDGATWNSLDTERDYLHIDDLLTALDLAVSAPLRHSVLNVGTGKGTTLAALAGLIGEAAGHPFRVVEQRMPQAAVRRNVLDAGRIRACWGWSPQVSLAEGVRRAWAALAATGSAPAARPADGHP